MWRHPQSGRQCLIGRQIKQVTRTMQVEQSLLRKGLKQLAIRIRALLNDMVTLKNWCVGHRRNSLSKDCGAVEGQSAISCVGKSHALHIRNDHRIVQDTIAEHGGCKRSAEYMGRTDHAFLEHYVRPA